MKLFENDMHELARLFMDQFQLTDKLSLDEFLFVYHKELTHEQNELGHHILDMFNYVE